MQSLELVLGIDGGGTKTTAWLSPRIAADPLAVCGRGTAGPSNPQTVGFAQAIENLDAAVAAAFAQARVTPGTVAAAVLALAGSDRDENRLVFERWAAEHRLAYRFRLVHDALPVLVAGAPEGWGIALIAGTGSMAFGRSRDGRTCRSGGWGFLFGDEGSGYWIAVAGLRAAARSADGRAPPTQVLDGMLARLGLARPEELIPAVYRMAADRAAIASLAGAVTEAASAGDPTAGRIMDEAAHDLADMAGAVARRLDRVSEAFPLVFSGGVLLGNPVLQESVRRVMESQGLRVETMGTVAEPVAGAVRLAMSEASGVSGGEGR